MDALAELLLEHPEARIVAGTTDVGLWVTKDLRVIDEVVDIVAGERAAEASTDRGDALEIGAGVTYADALPVLAALYPDIGEVFRRLGGEQVRNVGTIGGNIANGSPIGDSPPMLIALGARLVLRRAQGGASCALEDFFIDYGKQDRKPSEFVEKIMLPKPADRPAVSRLQDRQALRSGHLGGARRLRADAGGRQGTRRADRLWRHGGDAQARAPRPSRR